MDIVSCPDSDYQSHALDPGQEEGLIGKHLVTGLSVSDRVRCSVLQERLRVELLLLYPDYKAEEVCHLVRMLPGYHPREVFQARPTGRIPRRRSRTLWIVQ